MARRRDRAPLRDARSSTASISLMASLSLTLSLLFIYGEQDWMDPTLPIEWTRRAHNRQLRFIPNAGHQLFIEQPELQSILMQ